jgi:hypothetical protein
VVFPAKVVGKTLVQQAGQFGQFVGKVTVSVDPMGAVSFDMSNSSVLPVDDSIASDPSVSSTITQLVTSVEAAPAPDGTNILQTTLSKILGSTVGAPASVGANYFMKIGATTFTLDGLSKHKETPLLALHADSLLKAADPLAMAANGRPCDVSLTIGGEGVVRADLSKGKTGNISFADVYRILPLGVSPLDGSIGYPMAFAGIWAVEIRAVFEITAGLSYHSDNEADEFIAPAGMKVWYDMTRTPIDFSSPNVNADLTDPTKGRVTKMALASVHTYGTEPTYDNVIYDTSGCTTGGVCGFTGMLGGNPVTGVTIMTVATDYHLIEFAATFGVTLYDPKQATQLPNAMSAVKVGGKELKDWEVLGEYIHSFTTLPAMYNATGFSHRLICTGPGCIN